MVGLCAPEGYREEAGLRALFAPGVPDKQGVLLGLYTFPSPDDIGALSGDYAAIGVVIVLLIVSLGIHEAAHAWTAWKCGDSTAKDLGRLTLNPIAHIDPLMTIVLPAVLLLSGSPFLFGGAKPVPVVSAYLRKPARDMMLVAIAGPLSNLILAIFFLLVWKVLVYFEIYEYSSRGMDLLPQIMSASMYFNLILAIFNMLPIPPLDGSRVMAYFLPQRIRETYQRFEMFGMLILFFLLYRGMLRGVIIESLNTLTKLVHFITGGVWR